MENVSKSKPLSVKFPPEVRARMKSICAILGKSENALVNEAMLSILEMIDQGEKPAIPKLVVLAQAARKYDAEPPSLATEPRVFAVEGHDAPSSQTPDQGPSASPDTTLR